MRISLAHKTVYRYDAPVFPEPHTVRLRPRADACQQVTSCSLVITPEPAGQSLCLDQDGNVVVEAWFSSQVTELDVESRFEVETTRGNPFDFLLAVPGSLPMEYPEALAAALTPYREEPEGRGAIWDLATRVAGDAGGRVVPFLGALNQHLYQNFRHVIRDQGAAHPPQRTLGEGEGSCRDLAVLYCAVARAMGLAARFVSGYHLEAASQQEPAMHAWAEVYLPGGGWRGYDPAQGVAVADSHVAVAAAADPRMAAPITGSYRGPSGATMESSIAMTLG
jgi:transglutaminase-like putative cysteine protease